MTQLVVNCGLDNRHDGQLLAALLCRQKSIHIVLVKADE